MAAAGRIGHYQVLRVLGRGGMGEVFEGWDETLQRRVALKSIRADHRLDEASRHRFLREARTLSQLDDPGICRIFDYVQGDEYDVLVLELIEGRTLRGALKDGLDARQKLRITEAIARALVEAHRVGVVHRDLKSDNVMLTDSGTVKILDFGLARSAFVHEIPGASPETAEEEEEDDAHATLVRRVPRVAAAPGETRLGETVGTPTYMSPEQARGGEITAASDLYSFGLVLQELFSEKPLYPEGLTGREVMRLAANGESFPPAGVDHDVAALINRLKCLAPTDRPTGRDALTRIEWIRDRRKRVLRRIAAAAVAVLVLFGVLKYVADVRRERDAAIMARSDAELRRGQADALIAFMIGDLRKKLEPLGKLDVLDDVGDRALRYFASLRPNELNARDLRRNAQTLSQLGDVKITQGDLAAAETVLDRSLQLATAATERDPADTKALFELGQSHYWMGSLYRRKGDLDRALEHLTTYMNIAEKLAAREPANVEYLIEVAYGHSNVGTILEQRGDLERALVHYRKTIEMKERRLRTDPASVEWQVDLATTVNKAGVVLQGLARFREAEQAFQKERDLLQSALAHSPDNYRWRQRLAASHSFLAALYEESGSAARALDHFQREHDIETALVAHDPANASWQRNLASTDSKLARMMRYEGRLAEADARQHAALRRLEPLVKNDPERLAWKRDVAGYHAADAWIHLDLGDVGEARRQLDTARAALASLPDAEAETLRTKWSVALIGGMVAQRAGDVVSAREQWDSVAAALWPRRDDLRVRDLDSLTRALLYLGRIDDAAPLMKRLSAAGYRPHDLVVLWRTRERVVPIHHPQASGTTQKGL